MTRRYPLPTFGAVMLALLLASGLGADAAAQSGLALPRFVTLRADKVNMRTGPGVRYPIEWVYERRSLPVEVIAEFDTWRKVRDRQGTEGWVHQSMLSGQRGVVITGAVRSMRRRAERSAPAVALAQPGVLGQLLECRKDWCAIKIAGFKGWVHKTEFWGAYPGEKFD